MNDHLRCEKHDPPDDGAGNPQNGKSLKTRRTDKGDVPVKISRVPTPSSTRSSNGKQRPLDAVYPII